MADPNEQDQLSAMSWIFTEGVDLTRIEEEPLARTPITVHVGGGTAMVYRYGAVVLIGVEAEAARAFMDRLRLGAPEPEIEGDAALLQRVGATSTEEVETGGVITLRSFDLSRLRLVAEVLARSALLTHYESHLASVLLDLEPPVARLRTKGRLPARTRSLLQRVGEVLNTEMRMISRAEVSEKPEFVWDEPELDRLYSKLADEYELVDRDRALTRKLDLVMRTSSILLEALSGRRAVFVEWAIFYLILFEVVMAFVTAK